MSKPPHRIDRRKRAKVIAAKIGEGIPTADIAGEMGISPQRVRKIADNFAIALAPPNSFRFSFHCPRSKAHVVKELAESAGVSPSTMIARIVAVAVEGGTDHARRRLGKLAIPVNKRGEG